MCVPVVHVEIGAGGRQVVVEAAGTLTAVTARALELFRAVDDPRVEGTVGLHIERADDIIPPELRLPDRLVEEGGARGERRT